MFYGHAASVAYTLRIKSFDAVQLHGGRACKVLTVISLTRDLAFFVFKVGKFVLLRGREGLIG